MNACRPCFHRNRQRIDQQIVDGVPYRVILAENPGLSLGALSRHRSHIKEALGDAARLRAAERAENGHALLDRAEKLLSEAQEVLATAKSTQNLKAANNAIIACVKVLTLIGHASGELTPNGGVHVMMNNRTTINTVNLRVDDDEEAAEAVAILTRGFDLDEIERLKKLAQEAEADGRLVEPQVTPIKPL